MRLVGIVSDVFLNDANDLNGGRSARHAGHPVLSWDTQQLIVDGEAVREAFHPTEAAGIVRGSGSAFIFLRIYIGTGFQEIAAGPADIRWLGGALLGSDAR